MTRFILERLVRLVLVMVVLTVVSFLFLHAIPGDPVTLRLGEHATLDQIEAFRRAEGLEQPLFVQMGRYLAHVAQGDLGHSIVDSQPVLVKLGAYFPATIELTLGALLVAVLVGAPLGIAAAVRHRGATDVAAMTLAMLGVSIPVFWLGWMLVYLLAVLPGGLHFNLFPVSGRISLRYAVPPVSHLIVVDALLAGNGAAALDALWHLALPALTLGTIPLAIIAKITRSGMLDVLRSDYIRTARAKGLDEWVVVVKHALRNALVPILTVVGLQMGLLLGGAVLTEHIFAWPGVGRLAFEAISNRDMPLINGCILLFALTFVSINAIVDVLYAVANPRIRYG